MTNLEKRKLIEYVKKEIIVSLIIDHKMTRSCARKTLKESWLNEKIDENPELFNHDHPMKWANEIVKYNNFINARA